MLLNKTYNLIYIQPNYCSETLLLLYSAGVMLHNFALEFRTHLLE